MPSSLWKLEHAVLRAQVPANTPGRDGQFPGEFGGGECLRHDREISPRSPSMPIRVPAPGDDERRHGAACSERWPSYDGQVDSDSQVVIERNPEHGNAPQVGRVVRKVSGKRFVVDWGDGLENEVTAGSDFVAVAAGGIHHFARAHRHEFLQLVQEDPLAVLAHLKQRGVDVTSADFKSKLGGLDVDEATQAAAWNKVRGELRKSPTGPKKYLLPLDYSAPELPFPEAANDAAWPAAPSDSLGDPVETSSSEAPQRSADAAPAVAAEPVESEAPQAEPDLPAHETPQAEPDLPERESTQGESDPQASDALELVRAGNVGIAGALEVGAALAEAALDDLSPLGESQLSDGALVALATLPPKLSDAVPSVGAWLQSADAPAVLGEFTAEALEHELSDGEVEALRRLINRVLVVDAAALSLGTWIAVLGWRKISPSTRPRVVDTIARQLRDDGEVSANAVEQLARSLDAVAWTAKEGRPQLVAAVYSRFPEAARGELWWRGFGWKELVEHGGTGLSQALGDPEIVRRFVRPAIRRRLAEPLGRRGIAEIVAGPLVLLEALDPDELVNAVAQVATGDSAWRRHWREIRLEKHLDDAKAIREEAEVAVRGLSAEVESLRESLAAAEKRVADANAVLASVKSEAIAVRGRELRQARIDVMRTLSAVVVETESELHDSAHASLVERLARLVARQGLVASARTGESVEFDPAVHESPSQSVEKGEVVDVVRTGYEWVERDERVILVKALVKPITAR